MTVPDTRNRMQRWRDERVDQAARIDGRPGGAPQLDEPFPIAPSLDAAPVADVEAVVLLGSNVIDTNGRRTWRHQKTARSVTLINYSTSPMTLQAGGEDADAPRLGQNVWLIPGRTMTTLPCECRVFAVFGTPGDQFSYVSWAVVRPTQLDQAPPIVAGTFQAASLVTPATVAVPAGTNAGGATQVVPAVAGRRSVVVSNVSGGAFWVGPDNTVNGAATPPVGFRVPAGGSYTDGAQTPVFVWSAAADTFTAAYEKVS